MVLKSTLYLWWYGLPWYSIPLMIWKMILTAIIDVTYYNMKLNIIVLDNKWYTPTSTNYIRTGDLRQYKIKHNVMLRRGTFVPFTIWLEVHYCTFNDMVNGTIGHLLTAFVDVIGGHATSFSYSVNHKYHVINLVVFTCKSRDIMLIVNSCPHRNVISW